jgi:alpha-glucosidase
VRSGSIVSDSSTRWWQTAVVYQIYPRSFADGNGDGIGDLWGATERLDYLEWLGIDAIWLSPHFPSPQADFGYDVSSYTDVEPEYGTLDVFQHFLEAAHDRGIRVLLDLVLNHTSNQHPWFLESRLSADNPKHDWYIWHPGTVAPDGGRKPPNNWRSAFGGPGWTWDETRGEWYYHYFLAEQPDLNWRNPAVAETMWDAVRFWLDRGVDGFRLDAIATLIEADDLSDHRADFSLIELWNSRYERNARLDAIPHWDAMFGDQLHQPEVHEVLRSLRGVIDEYEDRVLVGETDRLDYCGPDKLHMVFNFPLTRMERLTPQAVRDNQRSRLAAMPEGAWPCNTMGNHDAHRSRSRLADGVNDAAWARVAACLTLLLPGTPSLYQGEEIGMEDYLTDDPATLLDPIGRWFYRAAVDELGMDPAAAANRAARFARDRTRTPMQWSGGTNAGFSPGGVTTWLPVHPNHATGINVADQRIDASSLLSFYQRLIHFRREHVALRAGGYEEFPSMADQVYAFVRTHPIERLLVAVNFSPDPAELTIGPHRTLWSDDAPSVATATTDGLVVGGFGLAIAELIESAAG